MGNSKVGLASEPVSLILGLGPSFPPSTSQERGNASHGFRANEEEHLHCTLLQI